MVSLRRSPRMDWQIFFFFEFGAAAGVDAILASEAPSVFSFSTGPIMCDVGRGETAQENMKAKNQKN